MDVTTREFILVAVTGIVTLLLTKGGPILSRYLNWSTNDRKVRGEIAAIGYEAVIVRLDAEVKAGRDEAVARWKAAQSQITAMEVKLDEKTKEHQACLLVQARLEAKQEWLEREIKRLERRQRPSDSIPPPGDSSIH